MAAESWTKERKAQTVDSPCVGVCTLNSGRTLCVGCYRTTNEIMRWPGADIQQKREILAAAQGRRQKQSA